MKTPRKWNDQPVAVERGEVLCEIIARQEVGNVVVEVRRIDYEVGYHVTAGNLFGSQTVHAPDANSAFKVIAALSEGSGKLPHGCELIG